jgi:peptidoglycan-associated lipoprotein
MHALKSLSVILSGCAILAGCSTTPKLNEPVHTAPLAAAAAEPSSRTVATVNAASDPLDNPSGALAQRSVFFDFDNYQIKSEYNQLISAHATYLEQQKGRRILIQGNTDERGGSEYNLALGQKRAEALRTAMATLGVPMAQMEAVSLGKEKPRASGSDEASWAQNRRDDIVYSAK